MSRGSSASTQDRLLVAAVESFAKLGYNGVSTRDIARLADLNEVTVYRYYRAKKDLFIAALECELQQLRFRADLVGQLGSAETLHLAMCALMELISDAIARQPQLVRLLQFSVLEFGPELHPLYLKYLRDVLDAASESFRRLVAAEGVASIDPRAIILAFIASIISLEQMYPIVWGSEISNSQDEDATSLCIRLWSSVLLPRQSSASVNAAKSPRSVLASAAPSFGLGQ